MNFNIDDPLAGILSDDSDGSFFDDDILGKKRTPKKKSTLSAEKRNALFDLDGDEKPKPSAIDARKDALFDLGPSKNTSALDERKNSLFDLGPPTTKTTTVPPQVNDQQPKTEPAKSPFQRTVSKESIKVDKPLERLDSFTKSPAKSKAGASVDKLNILDDLLEPKKETVKPLEKGKSSQSLLDDILGPPKTPVNKSLGTRPATAAKSQDYDTDKQKKIEVKNEAKQNVAPPKTAPQKLAPKATVTVDTAKKPKANDDWLGIFQNKDTDQEEDDDSGMPAWLVGDKKKKDTKKDKEPPLGKENETQVIEEPEASKSEPQGDSNQLKATATTPNIPVFQPSISTPAVQMFHGSNENVTSEGAAMFLEQQESQLMVALQLKAQEEKLAAIQMRQKEASRIQREAAQAQHAQVDAILQRQAEQRRQMQNIIAAHQERITKRIKDLLGTTNIGDDDDNHIDDSGDFEPNNDTRSRENPHVKEKKQLLQLVQSLQENHDKEIDLMETSYRRQLAFLEVSINQSEERMKEESDKLVKYYTEKIVWLEEHHNLFKKLTEENLESLKERHKAENEMLRQQHLENVKVLQEHHAALMENIKNAVKQEQVLIKDAAGFSADLLELVGDVKENKSQCLLLIEKVQTLVENMNADGDRSLQVRETQINDMIQQLKKERDHFETEKVENREMVKMLETRLRQMTTMLEEESATFKQKKMEFEFEKATFSKQTEFAKNILKKQDEEIKMLREDIQKEYKEKITKIDEEKAKALKDAAAIAKEKASIQNLKQELEKTKAEFQAQLEEVSEERSKMNLEKQQMHMEEQRILAKTRDLDLLAKTAIEKQTQADKKYAEAELIQKRYEDRIRRMQEHVVSLNNREKQIAKEKVVLSRERLSLHNERKQLENRQPCSLCKPQQAVQYSIEPTYTLPESFMNLPVSKDYSASNRPNFGMSALEQEMDHLIRGNFSYRHSTGLGSIHDRIDERHAFGDDNFATQATQIEAGAFKDFMDPKFMMLRLDVQQVLSNLEQSKKLDSDHIENSLDHEPTSEKD